MAIASLEAFDEDFCPATGRKIDRELIEDGAHQVEVTHASLDKTQTTQEDILRLHLELLDGSQKGNYIEHVYFFRAKESVEMLGADLRTIGFDADNWKKSTGRPFSKELPLAVRRMKGMRLNIAKATRKTNANPPKTFHNVFFKSHVEGYGPRSPQDAGSEAELDEGNSDTPF